MAHKRVQRVPAKKAVDRVQGVISLSISYLNKTAEVGWAYGEEVDGEFVPDLTTAMYEQIDYNALMAGKESGKPAGEFRIDDVFEVLDEKKQKGVKK